MTTFKSSLILLAEAVESSEPTVRLCCGCASPASFYCRAFTDLDTAILNLSKKDPSIKRCAVDKSSESPPEKSFKYKLPHYMVDVKKNNAEFLACITANNRQNPLIYKGFRMAEKPGFEPGHGLTRLLP